MTPGNLGFGIVSIQVHIGKDPAISIPTPDLRLEVAKHKLLARRPALLNYQTRVGLGRLRNTRQIEIARNMPGGKLLVSTGQIGTGAVLAISAVWIVLWGQQPVAVGAQGSAALITVLRAFEVLSFAPVARNHRLSSCSTPRKDCPGKQRGRRIFILARNEMVRQRVLYRGVNVRPTNLRFFGPATDFQARLPFPARPEVSESYDIGDFIVAKNTR